MTAEETLLKLERTLNLSLSEVSQDKLEALFKDLYNYGYFENSFNISNATLDYAEDYQADNISTSSLDWEILSMCGNNRKEEFWKIWQEFVFWCEGVILLLVGSMGCLGNIVAISILSSEHINWSPFHCLLIGLSISDLAFLAFSMPIHAILNPKMTWINSFSGMMPFCIAYRFLLYPFSGVTYNVGVFITMTITIERFQAVCYPHHYREAILSTTPMKRALIYIVPAIIIALVLNIPKFLEVQITQKNGTVTCMASELTVDETFVNWIKITYIINPFFSTTLIPIIILFVLNACIYRKIMQTHRINHSSNCTRSSQAQQSDSKLQAVLIIICVVFVITHFPRLVLSILAFSQRSKSTECASHDLYYVPELSVVCMETVSNLLIHVNASFNFLIYSSNLSKYISNYRRRLKWYHGGSTGDNKDNTNNVPNRIEASLDRTMATIHNNNTSSANTTVFSDPRPAAASLNLSSQTSQTHNVLVHQQQVTSELKTQETHLYVNLIYSKICKEYTCTSLNIQDRNISSHSFIGQSCVPMENNRDAISISAPTTPTMSCEVNRR